MIDPLAILLIGVVTVIGMILVFRLNAFLALITAAILVSLLAPGETATKIARVATAFGEVAGKIGIVIALAAVIGKCLMDSGAADRIVRSFLRVLGERQAATALLASGFVLSIPVFLDTVFYLLVPLARSLWNRTHKNYILYILAISAGGVITHTLVPPTPGPLMMAENLGIDLGTMILVGTLVGLPAAVVGLAVCHVMNRLMNVPMRPYAGQTETEPLADGELPSLWVSLLPVVLPVVLISANTVMGTVVDAERARLGAEAVTTWTKVADVTALLGNANFALLVSAAIAMVLLVRSRHLSLAGLGVATESALMSAGVIILITAAGGAFGKMLQETGLNESIKNWVGGEGQTAGNVMLLLGFTISVVMKIAQGSGTVAMITTSAMLAAMGLSPELLGFHPVYLATAIGGGSMVGSWMNDSGFWIYARMGNVTETEALRSWTVTLVVIGFTILGVTMLFARLMPMV